MASAHNFRRMAKKPPLYRDEYMKLARLGLKLASIAAKQNRGPEPRLYAYSARTVAFGGLSLPHARWRSSLTGVKAA